MSKTKNSAFRPHQHGPYCADCAEANGGVSPEGHICTVWTARCGVCGQVKEVTSSSDYFWGGETQLNPAAVEQEAETPNTPLSRAYTEKNRLDKLRETVDDMLGANSLPMLPSRDLRFLLDMASRTLAAEQKQAGDEN